MVAVIAPGPILSARGLTKHFGGLKAVENVDFDLTKGQVHALIGPNGAGKTTFVGLLSGRLAASAGRIEFDGQDITSLAAHSRAVRGIAYTFQITSIYTNLPVFDNVALAIQSRGSKTLKAESLAALDRVGLGSRADQIAGTLAYGHQRLLEVAMGLAMQPKLLILDEPTQGLGTAEIEVFNQLVRAITPEVTVLLIEHNMDVVMNLADRITVLNFGEKLATGTRAQIRADPAVQAAYLGG
ncbi:ABC transporter ATP-binding protein [Pseudorhodobacter sp.]|uniref:ABC transporter ATP-binding protein n=1 Tax=Pseudorhodobacter sp. TaxID=1934400 RepID=UPI002648870C|nr:ABC transporter ATP-binding protein [Pseudorhodobacter sp.]MDN5786955.1 ABC transporter ATP-binding protein [Pseudorhodobacter sp.]